MFFDQRIEARLSKFRLITLIVTVFTVTYHINEHIRIELLAVLCCEDTGLHYSFRIIAIYMQYRSMYHSGKAGTVDRGTGIIEIGCKADLVVDDKVNSTANCITFQFAHLQ
ncbi:hypothetical protein D3C86_1018330 [compost metagenome]